MKIKVTCERIYDSEDFYSSAEFTPAELAELNFSTFTEGLLDDFYDYPGDIIEHLEFNEVKE